MKVRTPELAVALVGRLERMRASQWAVELAQREHHRLELERLERAEDDTQRLGPAR